MKKYPLGTTIEPVKKSFGRQIYLVCTPSGDMCKYTNDEYVAEDYAKIFEHYFGRVSH